MKKIEKLEFMKELEKYNFYYYTDGKLHYILYRGFNILQAKNINELKEKFKKYLILRGE